MVWSFSICDAFYDRGSTFRLNCFLSDGIPSLAQNRQNVNLVSKNDGFVCLGHRIIHRDAFCFLLKSVLGWGSDGAPQVRSLRNFREDFYRRKPSATPTTSALLFWRVLHFLFLGLFWNNTLYTLSDGKHNSDNNAKYYGGPYYLIGPTIVGKNTEIYVFFCVYRRTSIWILSPVILRTLPHRTDRWISHAPGDRFRRHYYGGP